MNLIELEEKFNIALPPLLKEIDQTGSMAWLTKSHEWIKKHQDELADSNAFCFPSLGDCILFPFMYIDKNTEDLQVMMSFDMECREEKTEVHPDYRIIPFGRRISGDFYCFLYEPGKKEPKIIVYGHDTGDFDVWASDFEEFLFFQIISYLAGWEGIITSDFTQFHINLLSPKYRNRFTDTSIEELFHQCPEPFPINVYIEI